ncbi:MAG TPA: NAD(P)/FAD-dependent oxidoreductase [Candidatus Acidoferrales bacterium]|nr:NAD(P)/FAD-dependent oxidoreductase [Candidatus Acidoferrales bacterium]
MQLAGAIDESIGVVGASAAGLLAALFVARTGREVRIFERAECLNPAARTLIVTDRIRTLLGPAYSKCVVNEIRAIELFTDGRSGGVQLDSPDLVIERSHLIRALAQEAQSNGAKLHFGCRFISVRGRREGVELAFAPNRLRSIPDDQPVCCGTAIAADGAHSSVARAIGAPPLNTAPLVQAVVKLPAGMPPDTVRVWFVPEDTPYFYWLIPESREKAALGLIGVDGKHTSRSLVRFMEKHRFTPLGFQAARIPVYQGWVPVEHRIGNGRVFLVGDAAAQVKVTTLGGVVTGFRGAQGVSERILKGGPSPELRSLRRELDLHLLIRRSIHQFRQADYSRLMDAMNERMRRSLGRINRDQAARVLWHICRNQPRLIWMGLRGVFAHSPDTLYQDSAPEVSVWRPSVIQK